MATTTTVSGLPVPEGEDPNDIPGDVGAAMDMLDKGWIRHLTQAQIDALSSAQKPAGVVVWNSTAQRLERSNGTAFVPVIDAAAVAWQDWTPVLSQNGAVTWNAGTSSARWMRVGNTATVTMRLAVTGSGWASDVIYVTNLPVDVASPAGSKVVGSFLHFDAGTTNRLGLAVAVSSNPNAVTFVADNDPGGYGANTGTLANGDVFSMSLTYEVA